MNAAETVMAGTSPTGGVPSEAPGRRSRVLFVSWDGPGQNYLADLFVPILARLQEKYEFTVVQFGWGPESTRDATRRAAASAGITYRHHPIWRRQGMFGLAATVVAGARFIARQAGLIRADVLMPRSTLPAAMCLLARRRVRASLLFDADGFMPDERVEFEGWDPDGLPYRILRDIEARAVRRADAVIARSERGKQILADRGGAGVDPGKITVVMNGREVKRYCPGTAESRTRTRAEMGVPPGAPWVIYLGSLGAKYLPRQLVEYFKLVSDRRPDAKFLILTADHDLIRGPLREFNLPAASTDVRRVAPEDVPAFLAAADLGLAFISPGFSVQGTAAIKVGEYLLCGTPVLMTSCAGDAPALLEGHGAGRSLRSVSPQCLEAAAEWLVNQVLPHREQYRDSCRRLGLKHFSLEATTSGYGRALTQALVAGSFAPARPTSAEPAVREGL